MYVIVVGAGKVGAQVVRELVTAGHEVLAIERDPAKVAAINEELGEIAILGDGPEARVQDEVGMARADLCVATTGRDETNLAVCQVAQVRFRVPRVIARINNPKNEAIFRALGVELTVSATQAILAHIEQELPSHPLIHLLQLRGSGFELVEVLVPESAPTVGRRVDSIDLPPGVLLSLVVRPDGTPEVPIGGTILEGGSEILAVTQPEHETELRRALTGGA